MPRQRARQPLRGDEGAWEPMMLVAALAAAVWLGYAIYGERMFRGATTVSMSSGGTSAAVEARRATLPASKI